MTAPDTNVKKQTRRHRPALYGITLALLAVVFVWLFVPLAPEGDVQVEPDETATETE